jgi:hypothetical protein
MPRNGGNWRDDPEVKAEIDALPKTTTQPEPGLWVDDEAWTEADLPKRDWVAPGFALRGAVSALFGPPSAMKSSLTLAWACAVVLGRDHGNFRPTPPGGVIVYNVEDDQTEQRRRISAVLRQFDAIPGDIKGKLVRVGPNSIGTLFILDKETGLIAPTPAMDRLRELIRERRPAMLIADPLAELHSADENDNTALRAIVAEFRALAVEFNIAVILVHHTRKGTVIPGDLDAARGASSIGGAVRVGLTLVTMSEDDAEMLGLPKDRKSRSNYARLDDAKQNYAAIGDAQWYEKAVYALDNDEWVPAAVPWTAPDMWQAIPPATANRILDEIDAGLDGGARRYSNAPNAGDRAACKVVMAIIPSLNEKQARKAVDTWIVNKQIENRSYKDESDRKTRMGLYLTGKHRPGTAHPNGG